MCSIVRYIKTRPELFISLGFQAAEKEKRSSARLYSLKDALEPDVITSSNDNRDIRQRKPSRKDVTVTNIAAKSNSPEPSGYFSADVFPFVVHLGLMTATAFFIMHVQVTIPTS